MIVLELAGGRQVKPVRQAASAGEWIRELEAFERANAGGSTWIEVDAGYVRLTHVVEVLERADPLGELCDRYEHGETIDGIAYCGRCGYAEVAHTPRRVRRRETTPA